jgi:nondiscriminating aspartyl-tRNA synthetase
VQLAGWIHRLRQLRHVSFLILRDAKGTAQVVLDEPEVIQQVAALQHESVVAVTGEVMTVPQAPGGVEVHRPQIAVIAPALEPPPFDLFRPAITVPLPTLLDHAPLALRLTA